MKISRTEFITLMALGAATPAALAAPDEDDERPAPGVHPRVYLTPAAVRRARENVKRHAWAKAERDAIVSEADSWLAKSDDWYRDNLPKPGACFAYGFTGCPICGGDWGWWSAADCSFERPGTVRCSGGHVLPDADHPDPGTGYVGKDGRTHYFVGSYNAWAIEKLIFGAANHLAYAYSVTGDARYAEKAARVLDRIAAIYPACDKGSWDYPSNPPSGRLDRPWYQVSRVLVHLTDQYDQIAPETAALDAPSVVGGLTRRRNIEENMLRNGAAYCYEQSRKYNLLNNGNADYMRGAMAVGLCLDIPEYVRYAVDSACGARALLDNNLDRDGKYFETSTLYADHSRELYLTFAEPLANFRGNADYPDGLDLYAHPRLRRFLLLHNLSQKCCGRTPRYGDSTPAPGKIEPKEDALFDARDLRSIERLYARTRDPRERRLVGDLLLAVTGGDVEGHRMRAASLNTVVGGGFTGDRAWLLFHAGRAPGGSPDAARKALAGRLSRTDLFGQKGVGVLRRGAGDRAQALLMRFGPTLNHGHLDDLNVNFFSHGYELTYDLGYGLGTTHTQVGFARQTVAHNLVVVDEKSQMGPGTGGSLHLLADLPGAGATQVMEASSEASYGALGVALYRRTVALIDGFLVDIFRVRGGKQHDYLFHGEGNRLSVSGVPLGPEEKGSLAGADVEWGNLQINDGDIAGHPNKPAWNPPPGNGYGFLTRVRRAESALNAPFRAEWEIDGRTRLRLTVAPESPEDAVLTAEAPGIVPAQPKAAYLVVRRRGENLASAYAAVAEPYAAPDGPAVTGVERLAVEGDDAGEIAPVALRIVRADGSRHLIYSSGDARARTASGERLAGRFVHARRDADGTLLSLEMVGGGTYAAEGWSVAMARDAWRGTISAVEDGEKGVLLLRADDGRELPATAALTGRVVTFSNPAYSRNTAYRIARVEKAGGGGGAARLFLDAPLDLGRAVVNDVPDARTLTTHVPHEYTRPNKRSADTGFLQGKRLRTAAASTRLVSVKQGVPVALTVEDSEGFRPGDVVRYWDVGEGDRFEVLTLVTLERTGSDRYRLAGDANEVLTEAPGSARIDRPGSR